MARLFSIFARKAESSDFLLENAGDHGLEEGSLVERNGKLDPALFGDLGQKSGDIKAIFADLDSRLVHIDALTGDIANLRQTFGHFLRLYRDLALLNVSLGREKKRLEDDLSALNQHSAQADEELMRLRVTCDDSQSKLEKALGNIEVYEQNMQLLAVAKRELEGRLEEAQTALAAAADEEGVLRRESDALKARILGDSERIRDLSEKYQRCFEEATTLRERCLVLEGEHRAKDETLALLKDENVKLAHEVEQYGKDNANLEKLVNDGRAEMSAAFDRYQKDIRVREDQIGSLKNELKGARSQEHTLQKVNADLKAESEKIAKDLREALEINRQNEVQITRYETKISRLASDGEAALVARNQLDQARLAMVSRVEALSQALRTCEVDIRRLENEVSGLTQKNQDLEASKAASLEQLTLRIHELEGQLEHQMNENAYLTSRFAGRDGI
jgi:chromosome segregation ATPase